MNRKEIIRQLAPCGLSCKNCLAFSGGPIQEHAAALASLLGENFGPYAERFGHVEPVFEKYAEFRGLLDYLARGDCHGCREGGCLFKTCGVASCAREHGVDFCYECGEFPCTGHGLPERLAMIWKLNNERMRDKGLETFAAVQDTRPRYP